MVNLVHLQSVLVQVKTTPKQVCQNQLGNLLQMEQTCNTHTHIRNSYVEQIWGNSLNLLTSYTVSYWYNIPLRG